MGLEPPVAIPMYIILALMSGVNIELMWLGVAAVVDVLHMAI